MGMYTQIFTSLRIPQNNTDTIVLLDTMINGIAVSDETIDELIKNISHPFFQLGRWPSIFAGGDSYFNSGCALFEKDNYFNSYKLTLLSSLKNYNNEIHFFFDWISNEAEYIGDGSFLGHSLYEEDQIPNYYFAKQRITDLTITPTMNARKFYAVRNTVKESTEDSFIVPDTMKV